MLFDVYKNDQEMPSLFNCFTIKLKGYRLGIGSHD